MGQTDTRTDGHQLRLMPHVDGGCIITKYGIVVILRYIDLQYRRASLVHTEVLSALSSEVTTVTTRLDADLTDDVEVTDAAR